MFCCISLAFGRIVLLEGFQCSKVGELIATDSGITLLIVAGVMNASFTLPMKYARRWSWENTWLAWTIFALLALPSIVTSAAIPNLSAVYSAAAGKVILKVASFGVGWGVSQVFFGLAVDAIGIALTFSLVLGTSAAVGTLVPLLLMLPDRFNTAAGYSVLA